MAHSWQWKRVTYIAGHFAPVTRTGAVYNADHSNITGTILRLLEASHVAETWVRFPFF
jgi:hypothetical protein